MATLAVYPNADDYYISSAASSWALAKESGGTQTLVTGSQAIVAGGRLSSGTYTAYEGFLRYDTTTIPVWSTVTSVNLAIQGESTSGLSTGQFIVKTYPWSTPSLGTWVLASSLSGMTTAGSYTGAFSTNSVVNIALAISSIVLAGNTSFLCVSSNQENNTTPASASSAYSFLSANTPGRQALTITYVPKNPPKAVLISGTAVARASTW